MALQNLVNIKVFIRRRKERVNKKSLAVVVTTTLLVLFMAAGVLAAQNADPSVAGNDFAATSKAFTPDGTTNYPNEIYLPNETNPANYRIHSNYTATTDACASCHATHTGVGEALLQFGSVYDTCMACHDGTVTTTYDVSHGQIGTTGTRTSAGLFTTTAGSGSNHNVSGALSVYAAPGGAGTGGFDTKANPNLDKNGTAASWDVEFGCQSCHTPHGQGGNARLLNPDVNGYAWAQYNAGKTKNVALQVYAGDVTIYTSDWNQDNVPDTWIVGYPYTSKVYEGGTAKTVTVDNSLGYTQVKFGVAPVGAVTADFFAALTVKMTVTNYLAANETVTHGSGLNTFCGACHTDYNTEAVSLSGSNLNGTYTEAYRHKVGRNLAYLAGPLASKTMKLENGVLTCATCHVAHGTDSQYWNDTLTKANNGALPSTIAVADLKEIAGSSALKRLPNMGVCESCHAKGSGNQGYGTYASTTAQVNSDNQGNASYVGSQACQSCHTDYYTGWQDTLHSKMVGEGASTVLAAAMDNATTWKTGKTLVRNQDSTPFTPADVVITIGSKWKQRYLVRNAGNTGYAFLSQQYNVVTGGWEGYGNKADWDKYCITCHSTGYKVLTQDENPASPTFEQDLTATWQEFSVGCEACHGPGSKHKAAPGVNNIWNPAYQSAADVNRACGYCHNRGESESHKTVKGSALVGREDFPAPTGQTHEPWEDWTTYGVVVPGIVGADYSDYSSAKPTASQGPITDLRDMFSAPNGDGLYDDKKHHQQYQSFSQTGAGHNQTMSCASCHSSHGQNAQKEQLKQIGADLCSSCHGTTYTIANNMPMTGKTVNNVYVRTHSFSAVPTAQPAGALEPVNP